MGGGGGGARRRQRLFRYGTLTSASMKLVDTVVDSNEMLRVLSLLLHLLYKYRQKIGPLHAEILLLFAG